MRKIILISQNLGVGDYYFEEVIGILIELIKILQSHTFRTIAHVVFLCPESLNISVQSINALPKDLEKCKPTFTHNLSLWCN